MQYLRRKKGEKEKLYFLDVEESIVLYKIKIFACSSHRAQQLVGIQGLCVFCEAYLEFHLGLHDLQLRHVHGLPDIYYHASG